MQLDNNIRNCVYGIPKFIIINSLTEKKLKDSVSIRKSIAPTKLEHSVMHEN